VALQDRYCNVAWRLLRCIVDLFCGVGGFSLGAHHARFRTALAIDIDKKLTNSFEQNFPKATLLHADISAIGAQEITKKADLKKRRTGVADRRAAVPAEAEFSRGRSSRQANRVCQLDSRP
jgi:16S rRNA G966 N2-methylase RsmD